MMKAATTAVTDSTSSAFGSNRHARLDQNANRSMPPVLSRSRSSWPEIRNPEITKKTSTPAKPPPNPGTRM